MAEATIRAVIFDLGGVVLDSPLHAIARYERERSIPLGFINRVVVDTGSAGAWSRLERGKIGMQEFFVAFSEDCARAGQTVSALELMERIGESSAPRPIMLGAIRRIREAGLHTAALTNNWVSEDEREGSGALRPHFDTFIESSVVGLQKPDPRIYEYACQMIGIAAEETVFLDDIGRNLKSARQLGMLTIKVDDPAESLAQLEGVLGITLTD